jgi:hypothetical protein
MVCCPLVYFSRFGMFEPRKIWQPWTILSLSPAEKLPDRQKLELQNRWRDRAAIFFFFEACKTWTHLNDRRP